MLRSCVFSPTGLNILAQGKAKRRPGYALSHSEQSQRLSQREAKLEAEKKSILDEIQKAVEVERIRLGSEDACKARKDVEVELRDRDEQLAENDQKLKQSQAAELELRKRQRDLESEKAELELELEHDIPSESIC